MYYWRFIWLSLIIRLKYVNSAQFALSQQKQIFKRDFLKQIEAIQPSKIIKSMQQLSNKLQKIHQQIRKEQIASLMTKARYEMQRLSQQSLLDQIIDIQPSLFTTEHLQTLIEMANNDIPNALAHLGNLTIDRFLTVENLAAFQWTVGNNQKWTWLINVFSQLGYCTTEMFEHCIKRIIYKRSNFDLENALEVLQKSFKFNEHSLSYFTQQAELLLALSNHIYDSHERIPILALTILTTVTSEDESMPQFIIQTLGEVRTAQMLLHSLLKVQSLHRALTCQIANNFLMSGIGLQSVLLRILEMAMNQKEKVKLQISYYLKGFAEKAPEEVILGYIKRHKLLEVMQSYSKIRSKKRDHEISQNAIKALNTIFQRFNSSTQPEALMQKEKQRILHHMEKMLDLSQTQTIYQEESRVMFE